MAPDIHCRAALRLHRPTFYGPSPSVELVGPVRRSRHRAKRGAWRRMSIAGRRCACTGLRSFPFCGAPRPGKAQPPPGKTWRMVPDTHCRAALRLHRPAFYGPSPSVEFAGPVRRSRHRAKRGAWRRMSIAGRRCACTGLRSFPFPSSSQAGKSQPPPGSAFTLPVLLLAEDAQYILTMLQQLRVIAVAGKGQRQRELGDNPPRTRRHHQHPLA